MLGRHRSLHESEQIIGLRAHLKKGLFVNWRARASKAGSWMSFWGVINQIRKQRHTAKRIFERLKQEHSYRGSYTVVKDFVRE